MSLVVILRCDAGLVLASDSRATHGDSCVRDNECKQIAITAKCGVGWQGDSNVARTIVAKLRQALPSNASCVEVAEQLSRQAQQTYNDWFADKPWAERPVAIFTLGGVDEDGAPAVFQLEPAKCFAPVRTGDPAAMSGCWQFAMPLACRLLPERPTLEGLKALVAFVIRETAYRDPKVGGAIRLATITPGEGYCEVAQDEVAAIERVNDEAMEQLRHPFG